MLAMIRILKNLKKQFFIYKNKNYQKLIFPMGNQQIIPSNIQLLRPQNWIEAGQDQQKVLFSNVNPYRKRLLANIVTHQLIEQYELNFIAEEDYNNYLKQLSYRQSSIRNQINQKQNAHSNYISANYIYPIRYFINKSKNQMCTTIHTGYLYADKVDLRLKEINDIPFPDLLYLYRATLNGFKFLYEKVGYFDIQEEMIFITRKGQAKVWMNANLAKNYPNFQKNQGLSSRQNQKSKEAQGIYGSQADMIKDLIYLIQKNSDQYGEFSQIQIFSQFLADKNILDKMSFQHCLQQFELYLHQNNLHCSDHMRSIPQLFSPDEFYNTNNQTNYDQSHVNEVTSQHLYQMKKKFQQPMETIIQDQRYKSSFSNSQMKARHKNVDYNHNFNESVVGTFVPKNGSRMRDIPNISGKQSQHHNLIRQKISVNLPIQSGKKNEIRTSQTNFPDLNKSRHSHQSNNRNSLEYEHLQQSSNSQNIHATHMFRQINNPGFRQNLIQQNQNQNANHYPFQIQPIFYAQNGVIQSQDHVTPSQIPFISNSSGFVQPQFYINENGQKVWINSPPPSFRIMNNGVQYQNNNSNLVYLPQQNIILPPPRQHTIISNQGEKIIQQTQPLPIFKRQQLNNLSRPPQLSQPPQLPQPLLKNSSLTSNNSTISNKMITPKKQNILKQSEQIQSKKKQFENRKQSNVKYFTSKNSYHLDQQIANDLEKFLGLKVN